MPPPPPSRGAPNHWRQRANAWQGEWRREAGVGIGVGSHSTDDDLVRLGVSAQGARRKMLHALQVNTVLLHRMNVLARVCL